MTTGISCSFTFRIDGACIWINVECVGVKSAQGHVQNIKEVSHGC
jgi:hypothetical protein